MNDNNTPPPSNRGRLLAGVSTAAVLALVTPFVAQWEGGRQRDGSAVAYADRLAHNLPTACNGLTGPDIHVGQHYTSAQCDDMLRVRLTATLGQIHHCLPDDLPVPQLAAATSLAFNIGDGNFCGSSAAAQFRAHHYAAACDRFLMWNGVTQRRIVNGHPVRVHIVVPGLSARRNAERHQLCLEGLTP